jgi:hypothetical protein
MPIDVLDKQLYDANFNIIASTFVKWKEAKNDNKTLDNLAKCLFDMYCYTNSLECRRIHLESVNQKLRHENLDLRIKEKKDEK